MKRDYYLGGIWAVCVLYKDGLINKEQALNEITLILIHLTNDEEARK